MPRHGGLDLAALEALPRFDRYVPGAFYPDIFVLQPTTPPVDRVDILWDIIRQDATRADVREVAAGIIRRSILSGSRRRDDVAHLQSMLDWQARNVKYQEDPTDATGWQYELVKRPARAIVDGEDDCEGKVCVFCTLAMSSGYPAYAAWIEQRSSLNNHVAGKVYVPRRAAAGAATPSDYPDTVVVEPTNRPVLEGGAWLWVETTLGDVRTPTGLVRGPLIGEHPYDVLRRFRAAGVSRLGL